MTTPQRTKPTRSWLFTPGTRPERFAKARDVGGDVLIIDLEDAVSPQDKPGARKAALEYLSTQEEGPHRALRINGLDTPAGIADLDALFSSKAAPDYVVLPKTESAGHLLILDRLLGASGKGALLVGLIESARGLAGVREIAVATPRLAGLMLGAADMAADLGAATAWDPLAHTRSQLVAACALAGVAPIDSPFFDVHDADGLGHEVGVSKAFGFTAKAAIHPSQVAPINKALTPTDAEIAKAKRILSTNEAGVGVVDGQMVDEAVARKARRILAAGA